MLALALFVVTFSTLPSSVVAGATITTLVQRDVSDNNIAPHQAEIATALPSQSDVDSVRDSVDPMLLVKEMPSITLPSAEYEAQSERGENLPIM